MRAEHGRYIYWDSFIFLAYLHGELGKVDIREGIWTAVAANSADRIVTAAIAIAEVAQAAPERARKVLDPQALIRMDVKWTDPSILLVAIPTPVMYIARGLMRDAAPRGWALRPSDAIHLANALWIHQNRHAKSAIQTYDDKWSKFTPLLGIPIEIPAFRHS